MGDLILVDGIQLEDAGRVRFDCRTLNILHGPDGELLFESPYWWIHQITRQCDALIADMWRDSDDFEYTKYRTNIGISGLRSPDGLQEIETLGRLIYGFATSYLLSGNERYLAAARAGVTQVWWTSSWRASCRSSTAPRREPHRASPARAASGVAA